MIKKRINVNNIEHDIEAPEDMPLLWVIRDFVGLTGTKFSCGKGLCGCCTIHLDNRAVRSCLVKFKDLDKGKITTIEGLSEDTNHPVQRAWEEYQVPQCGYCQSGQIMQAVALLNKDPSPKREKIRKEMKGNLCRCGTYQRIEQAIASLVKTSTK